ncbi:MAG TPA: bacillithiol biosynthesis cysteine-adding enzyme BshC, partial [Chitinophagaceae bacterium]|nr:bacillithiol biosynthesis cysteine-adding enzyme BshC [Chitinophagaceae bacterium]
PYQQTGYFSSIVVNYLDESPPLRNFYEHSASIQGIEAAIERRKAFPTDRNLLHDVLQEQYQGIQTSNKVLQNIAQLKDENTFTICTAHQPGIFTGNLYFVYKILHAIRLADHLSEKFPGYKFVPVFYMGSEDADLDELGHIHLNGEKLSWDAQQKGAVGRMKTKGLEKLIQRIEGQLSVYPYGSELIALLKRCYLESPDLQTATFKLVNALFADYGLIVLIPDNRRLKSVMQSVFEDDLLQETPSRLVHESVKQLDEAGFKVQAHPREINLFYLQDQLRERIIRNGSGYKVHDTTLRFSVDELKHALQQQPEAFSPNVILRGLFQETILPNIAFIGGGGELAYWLELRGLFRHYKVPFPVLILRNSFLFVEQEWKKKMQKLGISETDIFLPEQELFNRLVKKETTNQLSIAGQITQVQQTYAELREISSKVDRSLVDHVSALETKAVNRLRELEKKLLRAEKKKFEDQQRQLKAIRQALFPNNSLQERVENFLPYYSKWGKEFLHIIYQHSAPLHGNFEVITTEDPS